MGLIKAATGAIGGTLSDQWKDFLTVPQGLPATAALFPAVPTGQNFSRGSNTQGSNAVITNGSRIVVPEGYGLLIIQDGEVTALSMEAGEYTWDSEDVNSQSLFAGNDFRTSLIKQSWERFKLGGRPATQQSALFVALKELPNNRFGTKSEVYWDDAYFNAQVGVMTHGTYSLTINDPLTFVKLFVPATYLQAQDIFDFTDIENPASEQIFAEVVGSLAAAFSRYTNDPARENRITKIQQDSLGFATSLSAVVEETYNWQTNRGLSIASVAIVGIEYGAQTKELLATVQRADALAGSRGNSNLQASVAQGLQSAGEIGGANAILGLGIAGGSLGVGSLMQPAAPQAPQAPGGLVELLDSLNKALGEGLISQDDFDAAKAKALGLG